MMKESNMQDKNMTMYRWTIKPIKSENKIYKNEQKNLEIKGKGNESDLDRLLYFNQEIILFNISSNTW